MTNSEIFNKLRSPIKTLERPGKGGGTQTYVPHGNVTSRINEVFGLNWNFEIIRECLTGGEVYAVVRIHYPLEDGTMRFKDGVAGLTYQPAVGLGYQLKGSVSLALVKAASLLGIDIREDESTFEQHEKIKELIKLLGGKTPTDERLKSLMYTEAAKLVEELQAKIPV
jgi:hypothetical protein